jgi:uncharacterized protein (TIGR02453 family)
VPPKSFFQKDTMDGDGSGSRRWEDIVAVMAFAGFPKGTVTFLAGLSKHNDKAWFDAHRDDYDACFVEPAKGFVEAVGPKLKAIDRRVHAEPKINGSIFRINRDVRFAKDKSPYKDHLDMWFWSGTKKGWDCSGFFLRLTPTKLIVGAGMHGFMPPALARYRSAVLDEDKGAALAKIVAKLRKDGRDVGGESYKKVPRGVSQDHPRAALLKHGGLYAGWEGKHPAELFTPKIVDFVAKECARLAPIHRWLADM